MWRCTVPSALFAESSLVGTGRLVPRFLKRGVGIEERKRQETEVESGGLPVTTATASSLLLTVLILLQSKEEGEGLPVIPGTNERDSLLISQNT